MLPFVISVQDEKSYSLESGEIGAIRSNVKEALNEYESKYGDRRPQSVIIGAITYMWLKLEHKLGNSTLWCLGVDDVIVDTKACRYSVNFFPSSDRLLEEFIRGWKYEHE